ncbi:MULTISPECIES: hypothetical protein [unclassified Fibrobacter]|uniref:hypothetical protein n=1 Tax=unclassified Fibrobacter TaxID=2634177 RepID=UPI00091BCCD1|nr:MULTISPECIES: hypothetical protein [unclassified Fibrobacter]SHL00048.1 hypothetical protein SAMN05720759_11227 [Fibrobacter sp. UWB12]SIO34480.1 hypothetical protein SAMN05720758_2443 [Fibrobacter sp. UWB11]
MEFIIIFLLSVPVIVFSLHRKRVLLIAEIRWESQPVMFTIVLATYCLCAVASLCNCLPLLEIVFPKVIAPSSESLELLNFITGFEFCFAGALVSVFARVVTIRKKNYTWKSSPKVRGTILAVCILMSAGALELLISILA